MSRVLTIAVSYINMIDVSGRESLSLSQTTVSNGGIFGSDGVESNGFLEGSDRIV